MIKYETLPSIVDVLKEKFVDNTIPIYKNYSASHCWYSTNPWKSELKGEEYTTIHCVVLDVIPKRYDDGWEYAFLVEIDGAPWTVVYPEECS